MSKKRDSRLPSFLALCAVFVVGLLVLSGCSGEPEANDSGPPSSTETTTAQTSAAETSESPTPSVTPTPTENPAAYKPATPEAPAENVPIPTMPELAKEGTEAGRQAFIAYYFELMNYTIEVRDPSVMSSYTVTGSRYLQNLMSISYSQGVKDYWTVAGRLALNEVRSSPGSDPNGLFSDLVVWDKAPFQYYSANGFELEEAGGTGRVWTIQLYYGNSGWVVQEFIGDY